MVASSPRRSSKALTSWPNCAGCRISAARFTAYWFRAADPSSLEEAGLDQFGDDPLDGPFGDADVNRDLTQAHARVARRCRARPACGS